MVGTVVGTPRPGHGKAGRGVPSAGYLRNEPGTGLYMPQIVPALRDRAEDVRTAWMQANSRANDAQMNSGWIAGVVEQVVALMIGTGLRLNHKPDGSVLGWDEQQTAAWARQVEKRWEIWASQPYECDATGRYTIAQMEAAAVRQWIGTGEIVAAIREIDRPGAETRTKVRLIPSHWLSQRDEPMVRLAHGVHTDGNGLPVGYLFDLPDPLHCRREVRMPARDAYGRPRIVHVFDGAAGQVRGITPLAPALRIVRQFDQLADATLTAAMIHAIFAATIESDYPTADVMAALQDQDEVASSVEGPSLAGAFDAFMAQKVGWHREVNIDLGRHGKIAHLLMGEKLKLQGSEHPNATYEAFANFLLREIASCLGVMPSDLTGDYRGDTYSSVRMGIAKKWPLMEYRRRHIPGRLAQAIFEAWLEEEIDTGRIPLDGGIERFVMFRTSIVRADWRGPPKPQADDVKAAKAHETWYRLGVMSQEMICNDLGVDHEDVHEQLSREKANRERHDLPDPVDLLTGGGSGLDAGATDGNDADDHAGADKETTGGRD
jgi:lambda family phage portal protein